MTDDLITSIKASLYDRTVSPLFGAVAISWSLWNYRLFVVLFSSMPVAEKLQFIDDALYGTWHARLGVLLVYPICTALAFIFLYPYPAKAVYQFWGSRQKELKEIRQRIEDDTPLTIDESRRIRRQVIDIRVEYEQQLRRSAEETEHLKQAIAEGQEREETLKKQLDTSQKMGPLTSPPLVSDSELESILTGGSYRLFYNPQKGVNASKKIKFASGGKIVEGNNDNESSWRVVGGFLELIQSDNRIHSRFAYIRESRIFVNTNDPETPSVRGQYIAPDWN
jgi:hypothetical protein